MATPGVRPAPPQSNSDLPGTAPHVSLGSGARDLLVAATTPGGTGWVVAVFAPGFGSCAAGGRQFVADGSRPDLERWKAALDELLAAGLLAGPAPGGLLFKATRAGYALADRLR